MEPHDDARISVPVTYPAYAVVCVDPTRTAAADLRDADVDDAWRDIVRIERLTSSREEAEREVRRLTALAAPSGAFYFWQYTSDEARRRESGSDATSIDRDDPNEWSEM